MKLYGAPVSPYVRKVLVYAATKGLDLELVPVGLSDPIQNFWNAAHFAKYRAFVTEISPYLIPARS